MTRRTMQISAARNGSLRSRASHALLTFVLTACAALLPSNDAHAMSAISALKTVCSKVSICGGFAAFPNVITECFEKKDDLGCALAVADVVSAGQVGSGASYVEAVVACAKRGVPIDQACRQSLAAAGVPPDQVDAVNAIVAACARVDDVDAAIDCAQGLLDSPFAKQAGVEIPSWVDDLFDIYGDIEHTRYWDLVEKVGLTVVCAIADYFTGGIDVCGVVGDVLAGFEDAGEAIGDTAEAVGNFFADDVLHTSYKATGGEEYFKQYWQSQVHPVAEAVEKDASQWSPKVSAIYAACYKYYNDSDMDSGNAHGVCNDMRDGTSTHWGFSGRGFTQQVLRDMALIELPRVIANDYALARKAMQDMMDRYEDARAKALNDLNHEHPGAAPPIRIGAVHGKKPDAGVVSAVEAIYGYSDATLAKLAADPTKWPAGSVGVAAVGEIVRETSQAYAQPPKLYAAPVILGAVHRAEKGVNLDKRIDAAVANRVAKEVADAKAGAALQGSIKEQHDDDPGVKALKAAHAACATKSNSKQCNVNVDAGDKACQQKVKQFDSAHPEAFDPDAPGGSKARGQREKLRIACDQDVLNGVLAQDDPDQAVLGKAHAACRTAAVPNTCDSQVTQRAASCGAYDPTAPAANRSKRDACENGVLQWAMSNAAAAAPVALHAPCSQGSDPDPKKCNAEVDTQYASCAQKLRAFDEVHPDLSGGSNMSARIQRAELDKACQKGIEQWVQVFIHPPKPFAKQGSASAADVKSSTHSPAGSSPPATQPAHAPPRNATPAQPPSPARNIPSKTPPTPARDAQGKAAAPTGRNRVEPAPSIRGCVADSHRANYLECADPRALSACRAESARRPELKLACAQRR